MALSILSRRTQRSPRGQANAARPVSVDPRQAAASLPANPTDPRAGGQWLAGDKPGLFGGLFETGPWHQERRKRQAVVRKTLKREEYETKKQWQRDDIRRGIALDKRTRYIWQKWRVDQYEREAERESNPRLREQREKRAERARQEAEKELAIYKDKEERAVHKQQLATKLGWQQKRRQEYGRISKEMNETWREQQGPLH